MDLRADRIRDERREGGRREPKKTRGLTAQSGPWIGGQRQVTGGAGRWGGGGRRPRAPGVPPLPAPRARAPPPPPPPPAPPAGAKPATERGVPAATGIAALLPTM